MTVTGTLNVSTLSASSTSYGTLSATNASTTLLKLRHRVLRRKRNIVIQQRRCTRSVSNGLTVGTNQLIVSGGNVGIGTTTPYATLSVAGNIVADSIFATSTTATSTFAGGLDVGNGSLNYDYSSGVTSINNLQLGALEFDTDARGR